MPLKSLTYTSWANPTLVAGDIESILEISRANNAKRSVTGLLIYNGSSFLQILEGAEDAIDTLIAAIRSDNRHTNLTIRDERVIEGRSFADWAMAYLNLEGGAFIGEDKVKEALEQELPGTLRNIVLGVIYPVMRA